MADDAKQKQTWPKKWDNKTTTCYSDPPRGIALSVAKKVLFGRCWMVGIALCRIDNGQLSEMQILQLGVN